MRLSISAMILFAEIAQIEGDARWHQNRNYGKLVMEKRVGTMKQLLYKSKGKQSWTTSFLEARTVLSNGVSERKRDAVMRKTIGFFVLWILAWQTTPVYGYQRLFNLAAVYSSDIIAYINDVPIESYNVHGEVYVAVEDLQRYGFDVLWDGEDRTYTIRRVPGKEPEALSASEYRKLTTREIPGQNPRDIYITDVLVFMDGRQARYWIRNGTEHNLETVWVDGKTLVKLGTLAKFYGTKLWDPEKREVRMTLEYNFAAAKTDLTEYVYPITKPIFVDMSYTEQKGNTPDSQIYSYSIFLNGDVINGSSVCDIWVHFLKPGQYNQKMDIKEYNEQYVHEYYIRFDTNFVKGIGLQCSFSEDAVTINPGQFTEDFSLGFYSGGRSWVHASAVELKLFSDGKEIISDTVPNFICVGNENIAISLSALAEALDMDLVDFRSDEVSLQVRR